MPGEREWRHNLRLGARPELVDHAEAESRLIPLAQQAMVALGLRFAAVDIVTVAGGMSVLEVNSAVTLEHFSHHSPEYNALAAGVYCEAIRRCFEDR
jgi:glutathione synthase/RimK-type ligase-like ATP-grasp enzyme